MPHDTVEATLRWAGTFLHAWEDRVVAPSEAPDSAAATSEASAATTSKAASADVPVSDPATTASASEAPDSAAATSDASAAATSEAASVASAAPEPAEVVGASAAQDPPAEAEWVEVAQPLRMQEVYERVRWCFTHLELCRGGTKDEKQERVDCWVSEVCVRKLLGEGWMLYRVPRDGDCAFASISVGLTGTTRHKGCLRRLATQLLQMELIKTDQPAGALARLATLQSVKCDFASAGTAVDVDGLVYLAKHLNLDLCVLQERRFRGETTASDFQWWEYRGSRLLSSEDDVPMVIKLAQNLHPTPHWDAVLRNEHGCMVSLGRPCPLVDSQLDLDCDCDPTSGLSRDEVEQSGEEQRELEAANLLDGIEGENRARNEQRVKAFLVTSSITGVECRDDIAQLAMGIQAQKWWTPPLQAAGAVEWECASCTVRNSPAAEECTVCSAPVVEEVEDDVATGDDVTAPLAQWLAETAGTADRAGEIDTDAVIGCVETGMGNAGSDVNAATACVKRLSCLKQAHPHCGEIVLCRGSDVGRVVDDLSKHGRVAAFDMSQGSSLFKAGKDIAKADRNYVPKWKTSEWGEGDVWHMVISTYWCY